MADITADIGARGSTGRRAPLVAVGTGWRFEVALGDRCAERAPSVSGASAPMAGSIRTLHDAAGTSVTIPRAAAMTPAMQGWVAAALGGSGGAPAQHDVIVTVRGDGGAVVSRWRLRRARSVSLVDGRGLGTAGDLLLEGDRIDLDPTGDAPHGSVAAAPLPFERRRLSRLPDATTSGTAPTFDVGHGAGQWASQPSGDWLTAVG